MEELVQILTIKVLPAFFGQLPLEELTRDFVVVFTIHVIVKLIDDSFKDKLVQSHLALEVIDIKGVVVPITSGSFKLHEKENGAHIDQEEDCEPHILVHLVDLRLMLRLHYSIEDLSFL